MKASVAKTVKRERKPKSQPAVVWATIASELSKMSGVGVSESLPPSQLRLYVAICEWWDQYGKAPTLRDLADKLGFVIYAIYTPLHQLIKKGYIESESVSNGAIAGGTIRPKFRITFTEEGLRQKRKRSRKVKD